MDKIAINVSYNSTKEDQQNALNEYRRHLPRVELVVNSRQWIEERTIEQLEYDKQVIEEIINERNYNETRISNT